MAFFFAAWTLCGLMPPPRNGRSGVTNSKGSADNRLRRLHTLQNEIMR
jgi:hypothetical protein